MGKTIGLLEWMPIMFFAYFFEVLFCLLEMGKAYEEPIC